MAIIQDKVTNGDGEAVDIYIEVDDSRVSYDDERETRGPREQIVQAQETFSKAMSLIRTCSEQVAETVRNVPDAVRPDGFEVLFSIKLDTEVGAVVARCSAEAQLQVTLKWEKKE